MNQDFHYYGTYVAAKVAGFTDQEAAAIAYAGQYVDDSSTEMLFSGDTPYITDFTPVRTVQTQKEIFKNYSLKLLTEELQNETARVWSCFHFLPGNYVDGIKKSYSGPKNNSCTGDSWTYDKKAEKQFKLLCLPNSEIGREMINDITEHHKTQKHYLQMVGLRMHTLADTWAHMYHAGLSAWFINDSSDVVELGPDMKPNHERIIWVYDPFFPDSLKLHKYACTNVGAFYNSFSYLGHGRMGSFPDYGFKRYAYKPNWSSSRIQKNNQADFLNAFKQMVQAMQCIRSGRYFNNELAPLPKNIEDAVKGVIATEDLNQSNAWKKAVTDLKYAAPPDYNPQKLLEDYKKTKSRDSDYYSFNYAALRHVDLVKSILRRNDIYIDEVSAQNNVKLKLKNKGKNLHFGAAIKCIDTYCYPRVLSPGVELSFINPGGELKSGDVVEIRTRESGVDRKYPYLMAWETPALYYHAREFGMNRSKWLIEKKGAAAGTLLPPGSEITIRNVHFTNKSYLEPYHSLVPPAGDYLTTKASSGKNEQLWLIEQSSAPRYYYIFNKKSQNVIQVRGASRDNLAMVEQHHFQGAEHQKFQLIARENGYFQIQAAHSGKMLDVDCASLAQNTRVIQYQDNGKDNQKFALISCGDGYCYIVPKHSGKPLKVDNESLTAGAAVLQYYDNRYDYQKFILESAGSNRVKIKMVHSGKYVTIKDGSRADLAPVVQMGDKGGNAPEQLFEMLCLDGGSLYSFKNVGSGLNLDVDCVSCEDNTPVIQYHNNGRDNQKFHVLDCDGGYKRIVSKHAGKCLCVREARKEDGAALVQYHEESPEYEMFRFVCADY